MQISEETFDDVQVYKLSGRLDSNTSPDFEKVLVAALENGSRKMVADFKNLDYISSAGLRVILKTTKALKRTDGTLVLCAMKDYVKEVFEISGFDTFLPIVADMDAALGLAQK